MTPFSPLFILYYFATVLASFKAGRKSKAMAMYPTQTLKEKISLFMAVLMPILVTQIGLFSMNFVDTLMSGRAGAEDLAGVAIGSSIWLPVMTGVTGVMMALTPIVAQHIGAGRKEEVAYDVTQGLYLSVAASVLILLLGFMLLDPVLGLMALDLPVEATARHYLIGLGFGVFFLFASLVLRSFVDALGETRVTMMIILSALPINVFFNYVLIFGRFGFPELGGVGAGYASAITYGFIFLISIIFTTKMNRLAAFPIFRTWFVPSFRKVKEILFIGLPIGFTIFFETSIFAAVTLLMSEFSTEVIAAHQAALNFASILYMLPLSIAMALTIAVGFEVGAKRLNDAKQYTRFGLWVALGLGLFACIVIYLMREPASYWYTTEDEVAVLIQHFLIYSIFFQLSDAIASPIQGVLRGYKDVNVPFIIAFISFWIIGLPAGFLLANVTFLGPFGYWVGLISALATMALFLYFRLFYIQRREKERIESIDL